MTLMFLMFFLFIIIIKLLMFLNYFFSKKLWNDREKMTPFECGFDPFTNPRTLFSIHFFLISLMFLIFDIEITLLIPMISSMMMSKYWIWSSMFFIMILLLGSMIEWFENSIKWYF